MLQIEMYITIYKLADASLYEMYAKDVRLPNLICRIAMLTQNDVACITLCKFTFKGM